MAERSYFTLDEFNTKFQSQHLPPGISYEFLKKLQQMLDAVSESGAAEPGASAFTDLTDTPASYTGQSLRFVRVSLGEDGLEFVAIAPGSGATVFTELGDVPASYSGNHGALVAVSKVTDALEFVSGRLYSGAYGGVSPEPYIVSPWVAGDMAIDTETGLLYRAPDTTSFALLGSIAAPMFIAGAFGAITLSAPLNTVAYDTSNHDLYINTDGGTTWSKLAKFDLLNNLVIVNNGGLDPSITFINQIPEACTLIDAFNGSVWQTSDGGTTFTLAYNLNFAPIPGSVAFTVGGSGIPAPDAVTPAILPRLSTTTITLDSYILTAQTAPTSGSLSILLEYSDISDGVTWTNLGGFTLNDGTYTTGLQTLGSYPLSANAYVRARISENSGLAADWSLQVFRG